MTVLVLDAPGDDLPPYVDWLAPEELDVVLITGRPACELAEHDLAGYAGVRRLDRYASGVVEREAVGLGRSATVTAIVAVDAADAIRAGSLRDLLGVEGQGRDDAIALHDLVALRRRLERAGVATVDFAAVRRAADLYWHGWRWGYPLRVRHRLMPGWPVVANLRDETAVTAFTLGGLSPKLESVPSLVAEPCVDETRHDVPVVDRGDGAGAAHVAADGPVSAIACAALAALPPLAGGGWRVEVRCVAGADPRIDAVTRDGAPDRARVRSQAGLAPSAREPVG